MRRPNGEDDEVEVAPMPLDEALTLLGVSQGQFYQLAINYGVRITHVDRAGVERLLRIKRADERHAREARQRYERRQWSRPPLQGRP